MTPQNMFQRLPGRSVPRALTVLPGRSVHSKRSSGPLQPPSRGVGLAAQALAGVVAVAFRSTACEQSSAATNNRA